MLTIGAPSVASVGASFLRLTSFSSVIGPRRDLIAERGFVCGATSCVNDPLGRLLPDERRSLR